MRNKFYIICLFILNIYCGYCNVNYEKEGVLNILFWFFNNELFTKKQQDKILQFKQFLKKEKENDEIKNTVREINQDAKKFENFENYQKLNSKNIDEQFQAYDCIKVYDESKTVKEGQYLTTQQKLYDKEQKFTKENQLVLKIQRFLEFSEENKNLSIQESILVNICDPNI